MPTEDEQPEQPDTAPVPKPAAQVDAPAHAPETPAKVEPVDVEAALAKQRLELEADLATKLEQARTEAAEKALTDERARLAEEHRSAALSDTERLAEEHRATEADNKRLADELAASKLAESVTAQKLSIVTAMAESGVRLPRNQDGGADPKLEALVLDEVQAKVADGLTIPAAIAELQAAKPWMFQRQTEADPDASKSTTTGGSRGATPGRTLGPKPAPAPNVLTLPDDEWRKTKRALKIPG